MPQAALGEKVVIERDNPREPGACKHEVPKLLVFHAGIGLGEHVRVANVAADDGAGGWCGQRCRDYSRLRITCILGDTGEMHKRYSRDLQARALHQLDAGRPVHEVAELFGVHRTTLLRWRQRRARGERDPRPRTGRIRKIGPAEHARLVAQVHATPDATLREHCAAWNAATGVAVSEATICRALQKIRWPLKKRA